MTNEIRRLPELLFEPVAAAGREAPTQPARAGTSPAPALSKSECTLAVPGMILHSLERCEADVRRDLLFNVSLTGGGSLFRGLQERLHHEVSARLSTPFKSRVVRASVFKQQWCVQAIPI